MADHLFDGELFFHNSALEGVSFEELREIVGFPDYDRELERYSGS